MKKHYFVSLLVILSIVVIFFSCGKDDTPAPVGKPVITISQSLNSDGIVTVKWEVHNTDSVFCNNIYIAKTEIQFPVCDSILVFIAKKGQLEARETIQVVKPASPTISFGEVEMLPYGGGTVIVPYITQNATGVKWNGILYGPQGTFSLSVVSTTTFEFEVVGDGGKTSVTLTVPVYIPSEIELKLSGFWKLEKEEGSYYNNDGPWVQFSGSDGTSITFSLSPRGIRVETPTYSNTSNWTMGEENLIFELNRRVISITESELVLEYESLSVQPGGPIPWFVRETFSRM